MGEPARTRSAREARRRQVQPSLGEELESRSAPVFLANVRRFTCAPGPKRSAETKTRQVEALVRFASGHAGRTKRFDRRASPDSNERPHAPIRSHRPERP